MAMTSGREFWHVFFLAKRAKVHGSFHSKPPARAENVVSVKPVPWTSEHPEVQKQ